MFAQEKARLKRPVSASTSFAGSDAPRARTPQQALGNQALQRSLSSRAIQCKLNVSTPGDRYEQEADRVADTVMRMPEQRAIQDVSASGGLLPQIQRMCSECEEEELQRQPLQNQCVSETAPDVSPSVRSEVSTLRNGGQPLPTSVRNFFEPRFGTDLSHVRIHTDARAAESARAINAAAYTTGRNIVFGASRYAPERADGQRLLAHELTHTIQQRAAHQGVTGLIQRAELTTRRPEPRPPLTGPQCEARCYELDARCRGSRHNVGCSEGLRRCLENCNPQRLPGFNP